MGVRGRTNWSRRELVPDGDVSLPRRRFASFAAASKGGRPAGRNPVRRCAGSSRPTDVMVRGGRAGLGPAPTAIHSHSPRHGGRGKPLPYGVNVETFPGGERAGGHKGPPLQRLRQNTAEQDSGRGKPLPYGVAGKHSPEENRRAATEGRPYGVSGGSQRDGGTGGETHSSIRFRYRPV